MAEAKEGSLMKHIALTLLMALTLSAAAQAGALKGERLSDDVSLFLNMEKTLLNESSRMKVYSVDLPPAEKSKFNDYCSWDSLYYAVECDGAVVGYRFQPICRILPVPDGTLSDGTLNELDGDYVLNDELLWVDLYPRLGCDSSEINISRASDLPSLGDLSGTRIDDMAASIVLNPLTGENRYRDGAYRLSLYLYPAGSYLQEYTNYYPIFALKELVPPYRHRAFKLEIPYPGFFIHKTIKWMTLNKHNEFLFGMDESFTDETKSHPDRDLEGKTYLVSVSFDGVTAREVTFEELNAISDQFEDE